MWFQRSQLLPFTYDIIISQLYLLLGQCGLSAIAICFPQELYFVVYRHVGSYYRGNLLAHVFLKVLLNFFSGHGWPFKVHMKRNQCFNILKVRCFIDPIPKFESCLKKICDLLMPKSCAFLLSKVVFELRGQDYEIVIWR